MVDDSVIEIREFAIAQFMRYGVKSVSMDDISGQIGISKKTLYKHFNNKEELIDLCMSDFIRKEKQLINHLQETSDDAIYAMKNITEHIMSTFRIMRPQLLFELQKYYKKVWKKIIHMQSVFIKEQITDNLKRGMQEGLYRLNMDPEIISDLYVQQALQITNNVHKYESLGLEKTLNQHLLYHLYGILSLNGIKHLEELNLIEQ